MKEQIDRLCRGDELKDIHARARRGELTVVKNAQRKVAIVKAAAARSGVPLKTTLEVYDAVMANEELLTKAIEMGRASGSLTQLQAQAAAYINLKYSTRC